MRITLVRHAEVIKEYQGRYNGHIDIPLSLNGIKHAKELALKLKDEKFDKIYCSDLLRAKQTLEQFSYSVEPIFSSSLREKSWGIHEGKSFDEIEKMGIEYKNFEQWISTLDGESVKEYSQKLESYFRGVIFKQKEKNILVVTHSGVIKTLISILEGISLEDAFAIDLPYSSYKVIEI
jgi:broad specificity phosphatase PhoE